jgi:hypothetical protein
MTRTSILSSTLFGLLIVGCLLISPRGADAQFNDNANKWDVLDVINAINRAIDKDGASPDLREKVVRRLAECSLAYGTLSRLTTTESAKKGYRQAQQATMDVQTQVAEKMDLERYKQVIQAAQRQTSDMLFDIKGHEKELAALVKNCKSLNEARDVDNAVRELAQQ